MGWEDSSVNKVLDTQSENLNYSDPQHSHKKPGATTYTSSRTVKTETGEPRRSLANLLESQAPGSVRNFVSKSR